MNDSSTGTIAALPITIIPELEALLPPLLDEEKADLRRSVEAEGVRESLLVWRTVNGEGEEVVILVDGHNRYRITESLGRDVGELPTSEVSFVDMDEAKAWIIANQLMRRNLTDAQRAYFRGKVYDAHKEEHGGDRGASGQSDHLKTSEKLAKQFGVSEKTIRRDASFTKRVDALPEKEKAKVLSGKRRLTRTDRPAARPEVAAKTKKAESTNNTSDTRPIQPQIPEPSRTLTPDDIKDVVFSTPGDTALLVFRAIQRADDCLKSLESVTPKEQESLAMGFGNLKGWLDSVCVLIDGMTTAEPVKDETGDSDFNIEEDAEEEGMAISRTEAGGIDMQRFADFMADLTGNGDIRESAAVKSRELQLAERVFLAKAQELGDIAMETQSPADLLKWHAASALYEQTHAMTMAVRSESGNLLRSFNFIGKDVDLSADRQAQLLEAIGGHGSLMARLTAFQNAKTATDKGAVLRDSLAATTADMFIEYRTMNLLSSAKTHIVNTVGNAATLSNEIWNRWSAEKMGKGQGIASGETWAFIGGMWDGFKKVREQWSTHKAQQGGTLQALRNVGDMWSGDATSSLIGDAGATKRSLTRDNALEVIGGVKEKIGLSREHGIISNGLSYVVEYMGRMLGISGDILLAQDQFFRTVAASAEVAALNHRAAMLQSGGDKAKYAELRKKFDNNTPAAHKKAAMEFGKLTTFQSDLGKYTKALNDLRMKNPVMRTMVPFFKTPANIIKYSFAHTPGLAGMYGDIRADLNSPDLAKRHLAEARIMTGTMLWATAIGAATSGLLTGSGPVDPEERKKLQATGWQANSLHLGDQYIALDRLDPAAVVLNTAASLVEIVDSLEGDDLDKAMSAGFGAAFRVVSDRTYLRSLTDTLMALTDWTGAEGKRARQGIVSSLIPASSMMRTITQQTDPVSREVEGIMDSLRAGIPGMSEDLPVRRNFLGEEVKSDGYYGPNWLSPLRQSFDKQDPVYDEIYRLTAKGHKIPSMPSRIVHEGNATARMNADQYSGFLELSGVGLKVGGRNAKEKLAEVVESNAYQGWTDEQKARQIQAVIEGYRKEARRRMKADDEGIRYLLGLGKR